jgi:transposase-like protein
MPHSGVALSQERPTKRWERGKVGMQSISYARHHFPPEVVRHTIRLYRRYTLSYCDIEELLAERGIEVSCETIRRWVLMTACACSSAPRGVRSLTVGGT